MPTFSVVVTKTVREVVECSFDVEAEDEAEAEKRANEAVMAGVEPEGNAIDWESIRTLDDNDIEVQVYSDDDEDDDSDDEEG